MSNDLFRQSALFTATNVSISVLGAVANAILARHFSTTEFGSYSFASAMIAFLAGFFEFGLFMPAGRLSSREAAEGQREIAGAALLAFVPIGLLFSLVILLLSFVMDGVFRVHSGDILRVTALLAFVFPFGQLAQWLAVGSGQLHRYSFASLGAQVAFVFSLGAAYFAWTFISPSAALTIQLATLGLAWLGFLLWLRPSLHSVGERARQLFVGAREYGIQVYLGRILSIGTYNMDVPMLGALATPSTVGFYVLADAIAAASAMPASAFSVALFRRLANRPTLDGRWVVISMSLATASTAMAWIFAAPFVRVVFGDRYSAVAILVLPLGAAAAVRGITSLYNSFLSAHGLGRELRNAGIALTVSNLVLNFALIPPYGALGAAWASLLALLVNLGAHLAGYHRYREGLQA